MKLIVATHNPGKVDEFRHTLTPLNIDVMSAGELDLEEPDETGVTFHENAEIKARAAYDASGKPALADDSGLSVTALNGEPGVYSARWAGPSKDFQEAMAKVHDRLSDSQDRSAQFVCVLCYINQNGEAHFFEGNVEGDIIWPPRGDSGFGYDPVFEPYELNGRTFAECAMDEKKKISHRGRALDKFIEFLKLQ